MKRPRLWNKFLQDRYKKTKEGTQNKKTTAYHL